MSKKQIDKATQDYLDALTLQFKTLQNQGLTMLFTGAVGTYDNNLVEIFNQSSNIDKSVGFWLDLIGARVGVARRQPSADPSIVDANGLLLDEAYRALIRLKIASISGDKSVIGLSLLARDSFQGIAYTKTSDVATVNLQFNVRPAVIKLGIDLGYIPVAPGVSVNMLSLGTNRYFALFTRAGQAYSANTMGLRTTPTTDVVYIGISNFI